MTPQLLQSQDAYNKWTDSRTSALFYLYGATIAEARLETLTTYSWLSPAASHVADRISQKEKSLLAYYCCQPEVRGEGRRISTVLGTLIYQLLFSKPSVLRQKKSFYFEKSDHFGKEMDDHNAVKGMVRLLREVIMEEGMGEDYGMIYIVIDRVDQCSFSTPRIMDLLADLVVCPESKVKIMITHDTSYSKSWDSDDLEGEKKERIHAVGPWTQVML